MNRIIIRLLLLLEFFLHLNCAEFRHTEKECKNLFNNGIVLILLGEQMYPSGGITSKENTQMLLYFYADYQNCLSDSPTKYDDDFHKLCFYVEIGPLCH